MTGSIFDILMIVIVVGLIAGIAIFLLRKAPFIPGEFKAWGEWLIYAVALLYLVKATLPLLGVHL